MKNVRVSNFEIGEGAPLTLVSGPCVIESEEHALETAEFLVKLCGRFDVNFVYKSSYDKANRSSIHSYRGPGLEEGLCILEKVKKSFDVPVFTDVHTPDEALMVGEVCDVIQIPAFLCRQTDLLVAAAESDAAVNVKKGQFMAPWDMENVVEKLRASGKEEILLTDRGTTFGYNNLVSDFRAIPVMQSYGCPVLFDATHSVQLPGGMGSKSGGQREFIPTLARAAIGAGCNGLFAESHPNPEAAKSDAASVIPFSELEGLLEQWIRLYEAVQETCFVSH